MEGAVAGKTAGEVPQLANQLRGMVKSGACLECGAEMDSLRPLAGVHEYPSRLKCATLPWDALLAALENAHHE